MHNLIKLIRYICLTLISEAVIIACTHVPPEPVVKVHLPAIEDATVQRFIRELHQGDEVELRYTEAVAVNVTGALMVP
jgi:hypothetical protein